MPHFYDFINHYYINVIFSKALLTVVNRPKISWWIRRVSQPVYQSDKLFCHKCTTTVCCPV